MSVPSSRSGPPASPGGSRFVGRAVELARLDAALVAAGGGSPSTFLIGGEAGVGKTRLLREVTERATAAGARVLCGSCVELGTGDIPFAPLVDALRTLAREIGPDTVRELGGSAAAALTRLAPFLGDQPEPEPLGRHTQSQLFEGTLRLFDLLGDSAPVLFIIEDLHWADRSTLDLLTFLARALSQERLVITASFRSGDLRPGHPLRVVIAELDRSRRVQRLELARFDRVELTEFVTGLRGSRPDPDQVARLYDLSDGNAFFVEELVAAGVLDDASGGRTAVPKALRDVVITRVEVMGADAQQVLRAAATAGRLVRHHVLAAACDLPERALLAAIRECAEHGLLVPDADERSYSFRHALARAAVYDDLLPGERSRLHADMAAALNADQHGGGDVTELAHHWFAAGDLPRAFAASLSAATEAANACAFAESDRHFARVLSLWDRVPEPTALAGMPRSQVLRSAADAARWSGHVDRAIDLTRRALAELPADRRIERAALYERLGRYLWESGDSAATLAAYVAADELLAAEPPTPLRARVRANQAIGHAGVGDHRVAFQLATEALAMARAVGANAEEGRALIVVGVTEAMTGQPAAGVAKLRTALGIAAANGNLEDLHRAYSNLTYALENTGRMAEALTVAYEALEHSRRLGLLFDGGGMLLANVAILAFELGRWDEAAAVAVDALEHEVFARAKPYLSLVLAQVDVGRGRFGDAGRRLAETGPAMASTRSPQLTGGHFATLAEMAIWQREPDTARRAVVDGLAALEGLPDHAQALWLCALGLRVEADEAQRLAARGNQSAALAAVRARGQQFASQMDKATDGTHFDDLLPEPKALWLHCQAELARLHGTAAARRWERAARYWDELGWRYPTAYTNWRQAEALLDDHDRGRNAGAVLQKAHRLARELRAEPLRHEIVRLAGRGRIALTPPADGPAPAPAARPPRDRFKLTRRELQVLRLLCEGHTNRGIALDLFITEKTASVHVSNILTKLGAGSRGEAAAIAHRLDLVPPDPDTVT